MTALTVGVLFASSGYATQTVNAPKDCSHCGNGSGNINHSDNTINSNNKINVNITSHSFDGNSILSNNIVVTGGSVSNSGNSLSVTH
jgi:hypothetical protein